MIKKTVSVTYTISHTVEIELEFDKELSDKIDKYNYLEGSDIVILQNLNEKNYKLLEDLEGGEYVPDSYIIDNVHKL